MGRCCSGYLLSQAFFKSKLPFSCKCCQFTFSWLLPWWRRLSFERRAAVQLQIPLISLAHYVRIVSNTPSAVTWSYKSPLRYLFYILQDLANPSVLPISYLDIHLPEVAVVAVRLTLFQTEQLTQCLFPQSLLEGIKRYGSLSLATLCGYDCSLQIFAPILFQILMDFCFPVLCNWALSVPWCLTGFLIPISRARRS